MDDIPIFLILVSLVGALFSGFGIYFMIRNQKITREGTRARAKIVDFEVETGRDNDGFETTYYYPILEFVDRTGKKVTQKMDLGTTSKTKSRTVEIFYLLEDGEHNIVIDKILYRYFLPWGFFILGVFVLLIATIKYLGIIPLEWVGLK